MARFSKNKVDEDIRHAFMPPLAAGGLQADRAETSTERSTMEIRPPMLVTTNFSNAESIANVIELWARQRLGFLPVLSVSFCLSLFTGSL